MKISNNNHYSTDAYLLSKKQYDKEHKPDDVKRDDITSVQLEEKIHAKTINAVQATSMDKIDAGNKAQTAEKAISSYADVENSQEQFNQVKEMV